MLRCGAGRSARTPGGWTFPDLIAAAAEAEGFPAWLTPTTSASWLVSMAEAVKSACAESGQSVPGTVGELMQCLPQSGGVLPQRRGGAPDLTGEGLYQHQYRGGGCQDGYLNRLTARATGLPVLAGRWKEGTALGNLMAQMLACGNSTPPAEAGRWAAVRRSFTIKEVHP